MFGGIIMDTKQYSIESRLPLYEVNYNKGYIGFTFTDNSWVSEGIAYFTRWDRLSDIPVSHALIVVDENTCIEAMMGQGVIKSSLDKYFWEKHTHISFRKPLGINEIIANEIVQTAEKEVGAKYANDLIVNDLIRSTFLGHLLDELSHDKIFDGLATCLYKNGSLICSELAAYCLQSAKSWNYNASGILQRPAAAITPQALFSDNEIFEQWKNLSVNIR